MRLSRLGILNLGFRQDLIAEVRAEETGCVQIHLPAQNPRELLLHRKEREAGHVTGLEFHQDVDVALRPEIVPENGAEERQSADVVVAAEIDDLLPIDENPRSHGPPPGSSYHRRQDTPSSALGPRGGGGAEEEVPAEPLRTSMAEALSELRVRRKLLLDDLVDRRDRRFLDATRERV